MLGRKIDVLRVLSTTELGYGIAYEDFIKVKLDKRILSDYDIDALTDLFKNVLTVGKNSDLDKNYLSKHKIKYCLICGSEKNQLISKNDGFTYQCENKEVCLC